jgi:hypothetical protein
VDLVKRADQMTRTIDKTSKIYMMQGERTDLLNEASRIQAIASAEGRTPTVLEDLRIQQLMKKVQALDEEISGSKR